MEKLTIDRAKWRTGDDGKTHTGKGYTVLLNEQGYMCCLGFECLRRGVNKEDILEKASPAGVKLEYDLGPLVGGKGIRINTDFTGRAMNWNDDRFVTSEEREASIKRHFATIGVEVEFIGEYGPNNFTNESVDTE